LQNAGGGAGGRAGRPRGSSRLAGPWRRCGPRARAIGRGPRCTAPAGRGGADGRPRRRGMAAGRSSPGWRFGTRENTPEARAGSARRDGLDAWLTLAKGTAARWVRRRGQRRRQYRQRRRELGELGLGLGL